MAIELLTKTMVIEYDYNYCTACDDYLTVSGEACEEHPLYCLMKSDPILSELDNAMRNGTPWGDILIQEEEERLNMRTPEQVEKETRVKVANERKAQEGLKEYVVSKSIRQHCEKINGKIVLKHKYRKPCENLSVPVMVFSDGSTFESGCWAHALGACPFMHPGEESLYTFTDNRPLKLVNGKQPVGFSFKDVTYLSNKTSTFSAQNKNVQPKMQDAW